MNERRDFLKAASFLPLSMTGKSDRPTADSAGVIGRAAAPVGAAPPSVATPAPEPVTEQHFGNYHLLGQPDPNANLFGEVRPSNWAAVKTGLQGSLRGAAHTDDPIHKWLLIFGSSFDVRATDIVVRASKEIYQPSTPGDLKYEPQLYDGLLRAATALLDRCLRYRVEMGQYEISGIGAAISYLTFLKLRLLQRNFLIQSNTADIAKIEKMASEDAGQKYAHGSGLDHLFEAYKMQAKQIEMAGNAAEAGLSEEKQNFLTNLLERQFHIQIDAQLAQFTRLFVAGSSSNFAERYLRLLALLTEDLADTYWKLYSAAKGIQQVLGLDQVAVAMNVPVRTDIPRLTTPAAVRAWVHAVVPPQSAGQRSPDILDAMVLWTRAVMRTIDMLAQYESEFTVSIPLNQPMAPNAQPIVSAAQMDAAFATPSPTGTVPFTLVPGVLPIRATPIKIRVIGIGVSVEHSADDASPLQFTTGFPHTPAVPNVPINSTPADSPEPTPQQIAAAQQCELPKLARLNATVTTPAQTRPDGGTYSRPKVFLPNVRIQGGGGGDLEPVLCYDASCRGLNPFGQWTVAFDPSAIVYYQSMTAVPINWVKGLILHLRLRATLT